MLLVIFPSLVIQKRQGTFIGYGSQNLSFVESKPIKFSFISNLSNLSSLTIDMKNPRVLNDSLITFDIVGPNSEKSVVFYGDNVGDPSTVPLKFTPFSDSPLTKYEVTLSTNNTVHDSLYVIANKEMQPIFTSYYRQSDIKANLQSNLQRQISLFQHRSTTHNFIYISLILVLNLLLVL